MDEDELRYREEVPCYCGKQGCIETFISGTGFATDYRRLSGHALKGSEIISLVEESDPVAELALRRYELRLAKSLAHVSEYSRSGCNCPGGRDEQCRPFISNGWAVD